MNRLRYRWKYVASVLLLALAAPWSGAQEDSLHEAGQLDSQFVALYGQGHYQEAIPIAQRALAIREKLLGPEHPDTALALNNLAALYLATGSYAEAEQVLKRAVAIDEKTLGPEHPRTATALSNLAQLYRITGSYAKAEPFYKSAVSIFSKAYGPEHPRTATALHNLAWLYYSIGAFYKAEATYMRALEIREKVLGPEHPDTADTCNNLASVYQAMGTNAKAELLLKRALAISEKTRGRDHPETANIVNNLAMLYATTGAFTKAETLYKRTLAIDEKTLGPEHPDTGIAFSNLATLYAITGAYAKAEPLFERAQAIQENNAARFLLSGDETRKRAYLERNVGAAYAKVSLSLVNPTPHTAALGLTGVLQYKGRVLDAMSGSIARLRESVTPEDQALFDQLAEVAQEHSVLTFRGPGELSPEAYRQQLNALAQQQEKLEAELSRRSAAFGRAVRPVTLEAVREALPAEAVLVEWLRYQPFDPKAKELSAHWGAPRYVAYVLHHAGEPVAVDLGDAQPIEALVTEFRTALSDPENTYYKEVAGELSEKLIKPVWPHVGENKRVLLSPDGSLNLLPFAALVDKDGNYLLQGYELTYLTSGRDRLRLAAASPARDSPLVIADPAYGQSPTGGPPEFPRLKGTADEAKALQGLLKLDAQDVLTGTDATEAHLKRLHGPRILHVATHGRFLSDREIAAAALRPIGFGADSPAPPVGENPLLRSGLALAGANARRSGPADDGILTAAEAAQLDLRGTQLVVLSACETGVGKVETGEGVYGLRRALVLAGAQTQITSLWKVADAATQKLMIDYYQRLLIGEGRSAALRKAQEAMMTDPAHQHPYYWAAFVPIGDWTPLPAGR